MVDVQLTLQVVVLVLDGPRQQARARDLDALAVTVLADHHRLVGAWPEGHEAGHREAPLVVLLIARQVDDLRVRDLVQDVLDLDDAELERLAHLLGRDADAGRVTHRLGHVVEQCMQPRTEAVDALAGQPQAWVTQGDDGAQGHGGKDTRSSEQALGVHIYAPGCAGVAAQEPDGVRSAKHDVEPPATRPTRHIGGHRPQDGGRWRASLGVRASPQLGGEAARLGGRPVVFGERHRQLHLSTERRRAEPASLVQLPVNERPGVTVGHGTDGRVLRQVGLDDGATRLPATTGAADGLCEQLPGALRRALIGQRQGDVRRDDTHERHLGHVEALGHETRADEHVRADPPPGHR